MNKRQIGVYICSYLFFNCFQLVSTLGNRLEKNLLFYCSNSQYNRDEYKIIERIFSSFLNRSISIIMDYY